jgi:hypothetical protein
MITSNMMRMKKGVLFILIIYMFAFESCKNNNSKTPSLHNHSNAEGQTSTGVDSPYPLDAANKMDAYKRIYKLKDKDLLIILGVNQLDSLNISFSLQVWVKEKTETFNGKAELIRMEDENGNKFIPEGTAIDDKIQKNNYFCDSTYSFASNKLNLGFGFEEDSKKRLCLTFNNDNKGSKLLTDMYYTLYRKEYGTNFISSLQAQ